MLPNNEIQHVTFVFNMVQNTGDTLHSSDTEHEATVKHDPKTCRL